ncbi:MAG: hydroxyacylglutathione hydrolase [Thiotrichales bacterium]|nr:hydroxyacylglutathione hydrolase [Thiotrichales bacterium]
MNIIGLPALVGTYDNYIWVLSQGEQAWVIDPGESSQVINYLEKNRLQLTGILITHFHHDHVDGIPALKQAFPNCHVYGPEKTENSLIQTRLKTGSQIHLTDHFSLNVLETPGHTHDHIAFHNDDVLFCGDTLFTGGCGRKFSGTFKGFADSILALRSLDDHTKFYCAHEYTESNLKFAALVEPDNLPLIKRIQDCHLNYPENMTQAQSSLALEKATNPFMRFDIEPVKQTLLKRGANDTAESLFQTLRQWKDQLDQSGELDQVSFTSLQQRFDR